MASSPESSAAADRDTASSADAASPTKPPASGDDDESPGSFRAAMEAAMRASEAGTDEAADEDAAEPTAPDAGTPVEAPIERTDDIVEAWHRWLEAGKSVPQGLAAFLRSSEVRAREDGSLEVRPIPGPAYERMSTPAVVATLAEGLTPYLSRRPVLVITAPGGDDSGERRITREEVREDTLKALYRQEPRLEQAVQELDLELMD
jgi:hypothetical protein